MHCEDSFLKFWQENILGLCVGTDLPSLAKYILYMSGYQILSLVLCKLTDISLITLSPHLTDIHR